MKKLSAILFFILISFFLYSGGRSVFQLAKKRIMSIQSEEIVEDEMGIALADKEEKREGTIDGIYVPYYWKSGIPGENDDYLNGYIPSIKVFSDYISTKNSLIYGNISNSKNFKDINLLANILNDSKIVYAYGIRNENSFFAWDEENCVIKDSSNLGYKVFLCDNWVNWMKGENESPLFVLIDCKVENQIGKCVFLDYVDVYFREKTITEYRCISTNTPKMCDWEQYIKQIEYK